MNGICWAYSRIPFVGARKKQLPSHLGLVSIERKTPLVGQIWLFVIAVLMLLPDTTSFQSIIDYLSPWTWVSACGVFASVLVFRLKSKFKDQPREFKVPLIIPFIAFCLSFFSILLPIITQPNLAYLYGLSVMVAGYLIYFPFFHYNISFPGSAWLYEKLQIFLEMVPNDYKDE